MLDPQHTSFPKAVFAIAWFVLPASLLFGVAAVRVRLPLRIEALMERQVTGKNHIPLPHGRQVYQVVQPKEVWPKIVQATIDPPDVHVGDVQKFSVVVQDTDAIASVTAFIETDHGTKELPLNRVSSASQPVVPQRYAVDEHHKLVFLEPQKSVAEVAHAADAATYTYAGQWVVEDTHDTFYHTKFVVKDDKGRESSVTLAWSDACGIPDGGAWTMSSNCTISSADGVDNGNATLLSGTLTLNAAFGFNPGKSLTISGGSIAIGSGGQIQQMNIWVTDADGDNYRPAGATQVMNTSQPAGTTRRYLINPGTDCDDSTSTWWQLLTGYPDGDGDSYTSGGSQSVCSGASLAPGYASSANGNDCNDSDNAKWQNLTGYVDVDNDTYQGNSTPQSVCSGNSLPSGYTGTLIPWGDCNDNNNSVWKSWFVYRDADGDSVTVGNQQNICGNNTRPSGYELGQWQVNGQDDCNDANLNVHTMKTVYSDSDGDQYAVAGGTACLSAGTGSGAPTGCPDNYSSNEAGGCTLATSLSGTDCYDSNSSARPSQAGYFTSNRGDGNFDYNCDSFVDEQLTGTVSGSCTYFPEIPECSNTIIPGWDSMPACGNSGNWYTGNCGNQAICEAQTI